MPEKPRLRLAYRKSKVKGENISHPGSAVVKVIELAANVNIEEQIKASGAAAIVQAAIQSTSQVELPRLVSIRG